MKFLFFILVPLCNSSFAKDTYTQYCFNSGSQAKLALQKVAFLKAGTDNFRQDGNCIDMVVAENRLPLIEKFMFTKFNTKPTNAAELSSTPTKQCNFVVTRLALDTEKAIKAGANFQQFSAVQNDLKNNRKSISSLVVTEGKKASLKVGVETLELLCHIKDNGIEVEVSLNGGTTGLKTTRFLSRGMQIELASISRDLKSNSNLKNINQGIEYNNITGGNDEKVYLSVK